MTLVKACAVGALGVLGGLLLGFGSAALVMGLLMRACGVWVD